MSALQTLRDVRDAFTHVQLFCVLAVVGLVIDALCRNLRDQPGEPPDGSVLHAAKKTSDQELGVQLARVQNFFETLKLDAAPFAAWVDNLKAQIKIRIPAAAATTSAAAAASGHTAPRPHPPNRLLELRDELVHLCRGAYLALLSVVDRLLIPSTAASAAASRAEQLPVTEFSHLRSQVKSALLVSLAQTQMELGVDHSRALEWLNEALELRGGMNVDAVKLTTAAAMDVASTLFLLAVLHTTMDSGRDGAARRYFIRAVEVVQQQYQAVQRRNGGGGSDKFTAPLKGLDAGAAFDLLWFKTQLGRAQLTIAEHSPTATGSGSAVTQAVRTLRDTLLHSRETLPSRSEDPYLLVPLILLQGDVLRAAQSVKEGGQCYVDALGMLRNAFAHDKVQEFVFLQAIALVASLTSRPQMTLFRDVCKMAGQRLLAINTLEVSDTERASQVKREFTEQFVAAYNKKDTTTSSIEKSDSSGPPSSFSSSFFEYSAAFLRSVLDDPDLVRYSVQDHDDVAGAASSSSVVSLRQTCRDLEALPASARDERKLEAARQALFERVVQLSENPRVQQRRNTRLEQALVHQWLLQFPFTVKCAMSAIDCVVVHMTPDEIETVLRKVIPAPQEAETTTAAHITAALPPHLAPLDVITAASRTAVSSEVRSSGNNSGNSGSGSGTNGNVAAIQSLRHVGVFVVQTGLAIMLRRVSTQLGAQIIDGALGILRSTHADVPDTTIFWALSSYSIALMRCGRLGEALERSTAAAKMLDGFGQLPATSDRAGQMRARLAMNVAAVTEHCVAAATEFSLTAAMAQFEEPPAPIHFDPSPSASSKALPPATPSSSAPPSLRARAEKHRKAADAALEAVNACPSSSLEDKVCALDTKMRAYLLAGNNNEALSIANTLLSTFERLRSAPSSGAGGGSMPPQLMPLVLNNVALMTLILATEADAVASQRKAIHLLQDARDALPAPEKCGDDAGEVERTRKVVERNLAFAVAWSYASAPPSSAGSVASGNDSHLTSDQSSSTCRSSTSADSETASTVTATQGLSARSLHASQQQQKQVESKWSILERALAEHHQRMLDSGCSTQPALHLFPFHVLSSRVLEVAGRAATAGAVPVFLPASDDRLVMCRARPTPRESVEEQQAFLGGASSGIVASPLGGRNQAERLFSLREGRVIVMRRGEPPFELFARYVMPREMRDKANRLIAHTQNAPRHPNLMCSLVAVKHRNGTVDVDAEYCDAGTLAGLIPRFPAAWHTVVALAVVRQVLQAIVYLDIVHPGTRHRHICPRYVYMRRDGCVKLDVPDLFDRETIETNQDYFLESPYTAPECRHSTGAFLSGDSRSDLWSVGALIVAIMSGCTLQPPARPLRQCDVKSSTSGSSRKQDGDGGASSNNDSSSTESEECQNMAFNEERAAFEALITSTDDALWRGYIPNDHLRYLARRFLQMRPERRGTAITALAVTYALGGVAATALPSQPACAIAPPIPLKEDAEVIRKMGGEPGTASNSSEWDDDDMECYDVPTQQRTAGGEDGRGAAAAAASAGGEAPSPPDAESLLPPPHRRAAWARKPRYTKEDGAPALRGFSPAKTRRIVRRDHSVIIDRGEPNLTQAPPVPGSTSSGDAPSPTQQQQQQQQPTFFFVERAPLTLGKRIVPHPWSFDPADAFDIPAPASSVARELKLDPTGARFRAVLSAPQREMLYALPEETGGKRELRLDGAGTGSGGLSVSSSSGNNSGGIVIASPTTNGPPLILQPHQQRTAAEAVASMEKLIRAELKAWRESRDTPGLKSASDRVMREIMRKRSLYCWRGLSYAIRVAMKHRRVKLLMDDLPDGESDGDGSKK